jgi:hypothetical protein
LIVPHFWLPQVLGVQPQMLGMPPPPQVSGSLQVPQTRGPLPQPRSIVPQFTPVQSLGVQPQTLGMPLPPQVSGGGQMPQSTWPPMPSSIRPQFFPRASQMGLPARLATAASSARTNNQTAVSDCRFMASSFTFKLSPPVPLSHGRGGSQS